MESRKLSEIPGRRRSQKRSQRRRKLLGALLGALAGLTGCGEEYDPFRTYADGAQVQAVAGKCTTPTAWTWAPSA